jgi:hypothetical protein
MSEKLFTTSVIIDSLIALAVRKQKVYILNIIFIYPMK